MMTNTMELLAAADAVLSDRRELLATILPVGTVVHACLTRGKRTDAPVTAVVVKSSPYHVSVRIEGQADPDVVLVRDGAWQTMSGVYTLV